MINKQLILIATLGFTSWVISIAEAATTNAVPWGDSFETYVNGTALSDTNGWSSPVGGAVVTNDSAVTGLLPAYPVGGKSYPLATSTHTNVLKLKDEAHQAVRSSANGLVVLEFMALPSWRDAPPAGDTNLQWNLCISTNGRLTAWHHNLTAGTNEWLELTNSPSIASNAWSRFTVVGDYANHMFQVRINEASPLIDGAGWSSASGGVAGGPWFHMVQTNSSLAGIRAESGAPTYLDDVVVTNLAIPGLIWSTNAFMEALANNGTLDNSYPLLINLTNGLFNGNIGEDFGGNSAKLIFQTLPAGLTAEAIVMSATQLRLRLLGNATAHATANNLSDLGVTFQDAAFVTLLDWPVLNVSTNLSITFRNPGSLTYASTLFSEEAANVGALSGTTLSLIDCAFDATNGENLVASGKVTGANVPGGLTLQILVTDSQHATLSFIGNATSHAAASSISTLGITFNNTAFTGANAAGIANSSRSDLQVLFNNPASVSASPGTFTEAGANDGTLGNSVSITLAGDAFTNTTWGSNTHYTVANVPDGLTFSLAYADAAHVTATLSGNATAHTAAANIGNLQVTFLDAAFMAIASTNITGNPITLNVTFANAPTLTYSGSTFTEISGGAIDNRSPITITLAGESFSGANGQDFVAAGYITAANIPYGLTARITQNSATQLSVTLTGLATNHGSSATIGNLTFTFQNAAFAAASANQVSGYQKSNLGVVFANETTVFNVIPYTESFESYHSGTSLHGTNGWTATYNPAAALVTNDTARATTLLTYLDTHAQLPISGTHTNILSVESTVQSEIHSESASKVYVDLMIFPTPIEAPFPILTNLQWAAGINTNAQLMIWHHVTSPTPTNEWLTLTDAPTINTSRWLRVTVEQDYIHNLYQLRLNEGQPVTDAHGWTAGGVSQPGSWFHMVQTNGSMSGFISSGGGQIFLDDLTVRATLADYFGAGFGTVFTLR